MVLLVPTRYARSASASELGVMGSAPTMPFWGSTGAVPVPVPLAETVEEAPELGAPEASLDAEVDRRLAQDLGFWGAGAATGALGDSACSAWSPFTFAPSFCEEASGFNSSPPSAVGAFASLEPGRGTAGTIGTAVREDDLMVLVEEGLAFATTAACPEVGVEGVAVAVAVSGWIWGGGDTGSRGIEAGLRVAAGEDAAKVSASAAAALRAWFAAPSCCSTGSSTEKAPSSSCLCFLFDFFATRLGNGSSGLLSQGSYCTRPDQLSPPHREIFKRPTGDKNDETHRSAERRS